MMSLNFEISRGNLDGVKEASDGADMDELNSALLKAVDQREFDIVKYLIDEKGADQRTLLLETALASRPSVDLIRYLVEKGADTNVDVLMSASLRSYDIFKLVANRQNVNEIFNNILPSTVIDDVFLVEHLFTLGAEVDIETVFYRSYDSIDWKKLYFKYGKLNMADARVIFQHYNHETEIDLSKPATDEPEGENWYEKYAKMMELLVTRTDSRRRATPLPIELIRMIYNTM